MKIYKVYSQCIEECYYKTLDDNICYFYTEEEAKKYCDKLNAFTKIYSSDSQYIDPRTNEVIKYDYIEIETETNPIEYIRITVDVKYRTGIYLKDGVGFRTLDDENIKEYTKVGKNWLIKIIKTDFTIINDEDKSLCDIAGDSYYIIYNKKSEIILRWDCQSKSEFYFVFPMYTIENETNEEFKKRSIDTAIQLMKQEISSGIAKKKYLPYGREGHRLTFEESDTLSGGYWSHVRAMSYMHDHDLKK
jgi:hypothetical protein